MDWMSLFYSPIKPFVTHPERIAAVASALLVMFLVLGTARQIWSWSLLWATGCWVAFALWEWVMLTQEADIRVDLLLIYPVLLLVTLWALWSGFRRIAKSP